MECSFCFVGFEPVKPWQRFCSLKCKRRDSKSYRTEKCARCKGSRTGPHRAYCLDCYAAYKREWYQKHRAQEVARSHAYNQAHPDVHRRLMREYWERSGKKTYRAWLAANPGKAQTMNNQYDARQRGAVVVGHGVNAKDWLRIQADYDLRCAYCGERKPLTMDHRTPISRGGTHEPPNIVPACLRCNSRKAHRTEAEYRAILEKSE